MKIKTEQDMFEFCGCFGSRGFYLVRNFSNLSLAEEAEWDRRNKEMINAGKIGKGSHLQQGLIDVTLLGTLDEAIISLKETPYLYPSGKILAENPELTGAITGSLINCYDPATRNFLFHMRGNNIAQPFGFQAAAAGMGIYGQNPAVTAALELYQEAGLEKFRQLFKGRAVDCLPFIKAGRIPQLLFSFAFSDDLSGFPVCRSLDDIAEFEARIKQRLSQGTLEQREGYHFTLPYQIAEEVAGRLDAINRFYGPIYDSIINFIRALKDSGRLY